MSLLLFFSTQAPPVYPETYAQGCWKNQTNLVRKLSSADYPITFFMVDATDNITGKTGLTPTVLISKNGGSYLAANGAVTEKGGGVYTLAGNATDRNTLGELWIHITATGAATVDMKCDIVAHDPFGDINEILTDTGTTIPDILTAIKGAGWSDETLVALMTGIESGSVDEATIRSAVGLASANLDTQLSTIDTVVDTISADMATVDEMADSVWDEEINAHVTAGTFGAKNQRVVPSETINDYKADVSGLATAAALQAVDDLVDELESRLTAARAGYLDKLNVTGTLANTSNADTFKADVSGLATASALSAVSALVDDLESRLTAIRAGYLDKLNVTGTLANTDNANTFKADISGLATAAGLSTISGLVDELESRLTAARAGYLDKLNVTGTLANTSNADTFKADVTNLDATVSSRLATAGYTAPDNAGITAIKAKTDNLPADPAPANEYDAELAALQSSVNAIAPLDEVLIDTGTQQFTTADLIKIVAARMVGKASGGGTGTITYRNLEDTLDIVIMTVDEFGNRSDVELK